MMLTELSDSCNVLAIAKLVVPDYAKSMQR